MGLWMDLNVATVILTTAALTWLMVLYIGMLRAAPSRFTWGLLLFAFAMWSQAAVQLWFFATMMDLYVGGVERLVFAMNLLALVAASVLLTITLRPTGAGAHAAD